MVKGNEYSFLHVDKAEIDLPKEIDLHDPAVYARAGENLRRMITDGVLIKDKKPCFYFYRLIMNGRSQTGLAACVDAGDYEAGIIKKHEFTRPDKEQDRVDHVLACSAHTGPIFMAYRSRPGHRELINSWCATHEPAYDFTCEDGVRHALWVVDDYYAIDEIRAQSASVPCLYIADGHHRSAAAVRVAEMVNLPEAGRFLAVMFPQDELEILDYNRLVKDLNGLSPDEFFKAIEENFTVNASSEPVKPVKTYEYGFYTAGRWYRLEYKKTPPVDAVDALAISILQDKVLSPVLNIRDPRSDKRIDFVGGARGTVGLMVRVDSGEMAAAFTVSATKMEELLNVADAGQIMPPKSTWFAPKLRSGLLIHQF
jgi:uncharacterized protein (DUF1015 family)